MRKKIIFYSQHLVGVGHHFRCLQILRELASNSEVYFIEGGKPVPSAQPPASINTLNLTPVYRDIETGHIASHLNIEDVLTEREHQFNNIVKKVVPDILMFEFFPFQRWEFKSEILTAIELAKSVNPNVKIISSLREIPRGSRWVTCNFSGRLPPRPDLFGYSIRKFWYLNPFINSEEKYSRIKLLEYCELVANTLNDFFDYILIHGDQNITTLEEHFLWTSKISIPIIYTGYVAELSKEKSPHEEVVDGEYVLVSCGGGAEGFEIIMPSIQAWLDLKGNKKTKNMKMVIFTGPYMPEDQYKKIRKHCATGTFKVKRFSSQFLSWMTHAKLSISRAGYNTCMNVLETRTPSILIPNAPGGEQDFRAHKFSDLGLSIVIGSSEIKPAVISESILTSLSRKPISHTIQLDGAQKTSEFLVNL